ncbi:phage tail sheath C-terminal domain-containing protein [Halodesulfovibrio aestuarii]|uniref:Phage tail sheath C-terminal domain-containing protein n=1 Tax=Halodesulfovibrio aestuarii TaxID=126333 RepID=A0ABV4JWN6_9BACT
MAEQFLHGVEVLELDDGPRPIRTVKSSVIGLVGTAPDADASAFPINTPVLVAGSRAEAAKLDTVGDYAGTLPAAMDAIFDQTGAVVVVVRVEEGADEAATLTNVIGGTDANTGQYSGVLALLGAKSALGFAPRILCAPGFTHQRTEDAENPGTYLKNPVMAELEGIAPRLRAIITGDGPNTNDADAIAARNDFGTARVYMVDPGVKVYRNGVYKNYPASAHVAGLISRIDNERGFWWSPSNQQINGISGTCRPIDFTLGDTNSRANLLNEKEVATIINEEGYRLWGNRTCSSDPKWAFLSVRRTADMINESILQAHLWAVDRNITATYFEDVVEGVNDYLRHLKNIGAILGGVCWVDEELNSPDQLAQGNTYFDFDFTPPAPAEHVTFRSRMHNGYFTEVFE